MEAIQIILQSIIILLGLYLAFSKSYFQEKGKNLATKEDVEEITEKVETIKNNLQFGTQLKLSLQTEERTALVSSYEKYSYWLNTSFDVYFGGINEQNKTKLEEIEDKLKLANFEFELAQAKMELFVNNSDLTELFDQIKFKTLQLQHLAQECIGDVEYILFEISSMKTTTPVNLQVQLNRELLEKRRDRISAYNASKLNIYKEIAPLNAQLQGQIYNHMQALLED